MEGQRVVNLKELFTQLAPDRFRVSFDSQDKCLEILADAKWADGFVCRECGNTNYCHGRTPLSRRCTRCKRDESATSHTVFHHCRMELPKAFEIAYMVCGSPSVPASEISLMLETRHMTCLNFKKRILQCLQSDGKLVVETKQLLR